MRHKQVRVYNQVQVNGVSKQGKLLTTFCPLDPFIGNSQAIALKPSYDFPVVTSVETHE